MNSALVIIDQLNMGVVAEAKKKEREEKQYKQQAIHGGEVFNPAQIKTNNKY
jgi:hypothetical protein